MSSVVIAGDVSGTVTLDAPANAGTTVLTLPATSGTVLTTGTTVTAAQGGTGLTSPGTSGNILTSNGTGWTSAAPATSVTSLNGQTGAITDTSLDTIGSCYLSSDTTAMGVITVGSTYAGSTLLKFNSAGTRVSAGLSGTWRNLGGQEQTGNVFRLYVRIS